MILDPSKWQAVYDQWFCGAYLVCTQCNPTVTMEGSPDDAEETGAEIDMDGLTLAEVLARAAEHAVGHAQG